MQDFLFQLLALLKVYQLLQSFGLASDCWKHVEHCVLEKSCQYHFSNRTTPEPSVCLSSYFQEGQKLEENILYLSLLGTDEGLREDQTERVQMLEEKICDLEVKNTS